MALEIYAGSITDYYAASLRSQAPDAGWTDDKVRARVIAWRSQISSGLEAQGHLREPLTWDEAAGASRRSSLPMDSLRALKLFSLYAEQSAAAAPEFLPEDAESDPLWQRASDADFADNRYAQILAPAFWLPGGFSFTFRCPYPDGHEVETGSTGCLHDELERLGQREFHFSNEMDPAWLLEPSDEPSLYERARHGWAILWQRCLDARERDVPLVMHA